MQPNSSYTFRRRPLTCLIASLLGASLFYAAWLALFLSIYDHVAPWAQAALWVTAPVITALGYATGFQVAGRIVRRPSQRFLSVFVWPLIGCAIGAGLVFPFGPMLIVFGMFGAGTATLAIREVLMLRSGHADG